MSKLWLLLLLVAAFQAIHSYPFGVERSTGEKLLASMKDTWGKIKQGYKEYSQEKINKFIGKLEGKLCKDETESDFEEDEVQGVSVTNPTLTEKLVMKVKELMKEVGDKIDVKKENTKKKYNEIKGLLCNKLKDYQEVHDEVASVESDDLNSDKSVRFWNPIKAAAIKIKDQTTALMTNTIKKIKDKLDNRFCSKNSDLEKELEEDAGEENKKDKLPLVKKLKEIYLETKQKFEGQEAKLKEATAKLKEDFCSKLKNTDTGDLDPEEESDYEDDESEVEVSTWDFLKSSWNEHLDQYKQWGKQGVQKLIAKLKERLCVEEESVEEDAESIAKTGPTEKFAQYVKDLLQKSTTAVGAQKEKLKESLKEAKAMLCEKLSGYEEDPYFEENIDIGQSEESDEDAVAKIEPAWKVITGKLALLKDKWVSIGKNNLQKIIQAFSNKFCTKEIDLGEELESDAGQDVIANNSPIIQKLKEIYNQAKKKVGEQKDKIKEVQREILQKFCNKLQDSAAEEEDYGADLDEVDLEGVDFVVEGDERGILKGIGKGLKKGLKAAAKKGLKQLKKGLKQAMKKGIKYIKHNAIKVKPLECEGKSCKSCIILNIPGQPQSACISMLLTRVDKKSSLKVAVKINDASQYEQDVELGAVPRCLNVGGAIGKICLKGLKGQGKSSKGAAKVNFCLAVVAENFGVGCKFCAVYENDKMKMKISPKLFAGGFDDDNNDILQLDEETEENGFQLDADEFEIDD